MSTQKFHTEILVAAETTPLTDTQLEEEMQLIRAGNARSSEQSALINKMVAEIGDEFGYSSSWELFARAGDTSDTSGRIAGRAMAARTNGQLLGFPAGRPYLHPNFQFTTAPAIHPGLEIVLFEANRAGLSHLGLFLWLCSPTPSLSGGRPVDFLANKELLLESFSTDFDLPYPE